MEWLLALSALGALAGVVVPQLGERSARARDARRLASLREVRDAIERHRLERGAWPEAELRPDGRGWDVSCDGAFIPVLVERGYLSAPPRDPLDGPRHHFVYRVYPSGTAGCSWDGPFYVLGLTAYETSDYAARHPGGFACPERDWGEELDYVTGGGLPPR